MSLLQPVREDMMPRLRAYLTRAGYASLVSEVSPDILDVAKEIYARALEIAVPLAAVAHYGGDEMPAASLPNELTGCREYSVMLFSLGRGIDEAIDGYFSSGEPLRALFLDSWGSEAVEALACNVDEGLRKNLGDGTIRFAPGYSGFDIRHNLGWLSMIRERCAEPMEVSVNADTGIITPRKTIICMIGWR
ncbi:MAG: hypothetical protein LBT08_02545 [Synergistaceae bacterium]|nr:hypothetical protein [Synergistaceae bacterium]